MTDTFHRIEESVAKSEVLAAGVVLDGRGRFPPQPGRHTGLERLAACRRGTARDQRSFCVEVSEALISGSEGSNGRRVDRVISIVGASQDTPSQPLHLRPQQLKRVEAPIRHP